MGTRDKSRYTEVEGVETTDIENFPYSALKTLGGIHLGIGVTCLVLGLIDIILYLFVDDSDLLATNTTLMTMTIASTPVWCGLWFCVTGCMAACMSKHNKTSLVYFKLTFLVLSILCAALFAPVCCVINIIMATERHTLDESSYRWMVSILVAFFAFNEIILSIVSASMCCCCAVIKTTKVRVLLAKQEGLRESSINIERERSGDSTEIFTTADRDGRPLNRTADEYRTADRHNSKLGSRAAEDYRPNTKDSVSSYQRLKKLTLPSSSFPVTKEEDPLDKF